MKNNLGYLALSLGLISMSFRFDITSETTAVSWIWQDNFIVGILLFALAIILAVLSFIKHRKALNTG